MPTPEGDVKKQTREMLEGLGLVCASKAVLCVTGKTGWFYMPVSNGMGVHGIPDFIGHYKGKFFAIEAKSPNKNPTALQQIQLDALRITGAIEMVVHDTSEILRAKLLLSRYL